MIYGLLINYLLPITGVLKPLSELPLKISVNFLVFILLIVNIIRGLRDGTIAHLTILRGNYKRVLPVIMPFIALFTGVAGTVLLNNGGTSLLSWLSLIIITIIFIYLFLTYRQVSDTGFATTLFLVALTLLLQQSLRSWYISGSDIHDEYIVFQNTLANGRWTPGGTNPVYNACLSITVLPVIISHLTGISGTYVYKLIYPLIFSTVAPLIYYLFRRFTESCIAFLGVTYIVIQPFFVKPMVSLARQEIAFLFFCLLLHVLFTENTGFRRRMLILLFGFGLVVSHYSTVYTLIALFGSTVIINRIIVLITNKLRLKSYPGSAITEKFVLVLLLVTQLWYSQLNPSTDNLAETVKETVKNMRSIFNQETKNQEVARSLAFFAPAKINTQEQIDSFNQKEGAARQNYLPNYYTPESYGGYYPYVVTDSSTPSLFSRTINRILYLLFNVVKSITKLYIIIGIAAVIIFANKLRKQPDFLIMCTLGTILVGLVMFHPTLASRYNLSRIYLNVLFPLALPAVLGTSIILERVRRSSGIYIIFGSLLYVFLFYSGLAGVFTGGEAVIQLVNAGHDYDKFYVFRNDIVAADWLKNNRDVSAPINADTYASLILKSSADIAYTNRIILPQAIAKNTYVFARTANIAGNRVNGSYEGNDITYIFPESFLSINKNKVYSTGTTRIYR
jgi:uncharacterized membrane protein